MREFYYQRKNGDDQGQADGLGSYFYKREQNSVTHELAQLPKYIQLCGVLMPWRVLSKLLLKIKF